MRDALRMVATLRSALYSRLDLFFEILSLRHQRAFSLVPIDASVQSTVCSGCACNGVGLDVSERSVARYLRHLSRRGDSARRWAAFLANHREAIVACDFFTVPTVTFQLLWCFFVIEHRRRTILHVNVTRDPTAAWVVQELRVFPGDGPYRFILLDHDSTFDDEVIAFLKATGLDPKRTGVQAPRQNGLAERWVGGCRRELLDHIVALNERHLSRLLREYVAYHHYDRIHDAFCLYRTAGPLPPAS